jgi:hypothetical protein
MQALAIRSFDPENLNQAIDLAKTLAQSTLLPDALKQKPADVLLMMLTGRELGLSPMQSIRGMSVIKGRPVLDAQLIVALVKRSPECINFRLVDSSDKIAVYSTERRNEGVTRLSFTIEEANQAGLLHKSQSGEPNNWMKYPAAMLRARAATHLARAVYPDLLLGVTSEEESVEQPSSEPRQAVVIESHAVATSVPQTTVASAIRAQAHQPAAHAQAAQQSKTPPAAVEHLGAVASSELAGKAPPPVAEVPAPGVAAPLVAEPRHDPVTGEVQQGREPGCDDGDTVDATFTAGAPTTPAVDPLAAKVAELAAKIQACTSLPELESLVTLIRALPQDRVGPLRDAYAAKRNSLVPPKVA